MDIKEKFRNAKANAEAKWIAFQYRFETKAIAVGNWMARNKEVTIAMIPIGLVAIRGIGNTIRSIDRKMNLEKEQKLQDLYVYDHSLGMYHKLRRPMTPSEKIELDRRRNEGESKIQILASMGLLD